jgi:hypothetical protein
MSEPDTSEDSGGIRRALIAVCTFGLLGTIAALWLGGVNPALSVAIGAGIAAGNLWLLAQMVRAFLAQKGATAPWGIVAVLKFALLFGAMYVLVKTRTVDILPCAIGFCALPVGIVFAQLLGARRDQRES